MQRATVLTGRKGQVLAHAGTAAVSSQVVFEFVTEVPHRGEHGIGGRLPQPAQRGVADHSAQFVQGVQILFRSLPSRELVQDAERLIESHAAGHTLAARLRVSKLDEIAGDVHHAVVVIHYDHAARAHNGAKLGQTFIVHRRIEHFLGDTAA